MRHQMHLAVQRHHLVKDTLGEGEAYLLLSVRPIHSGQIHLIDDRLGDRDTRYPIIDEGCCTGTDDRELPQDQMGLLGGFTDALCFGLLKEGEQLFGIVQIVDRLGDDRSGTVIELFEHAFLEVFHIFGMGIGHSEGVDRLGCRIEGVVGVVHTVVETVDDAQQQGGVALQHPFDLRLVAEFGGVTCQREDAADIEIIGTEQIGLQRELVFVPHTHRSNDRLAKGLLDFDR